MNHALEACLLGPPSVLGVLLVLIVLVFAPGAENLAQVRSEFEARVRACALPNWRARGVDCHQVWYGPK